MRDDNPTSRAALSALAIALTTCAPAAAPPAAAPPSGAAASEQPALPTEPAPLGPALTPAKQGAFFTREFRNLFAELGKPIAEIQAKVDIAYAKLFHGDPKEEAVMFAAGSNDRGPMSYIMDIGNSDIRSEGMSYGMMIAVQMDRKNDFDALWNWAKTYMYHANPGHPAYGYFSWQMRPEGTAVDEMPAPDGEEYFATALLFAAHRWGSGEGIYQYEVEALTLLDHMKNRTAIKGLVNGTRETTGLALFNPDHKMVRFTPNADNFAKNGDHTDPSYHLPAFYELWALWGPERDRMFWAEAAKVSRDYFVKVTNPDTGLAPDYANYDGTPKAATWDAGTENFRYDAWRTAMNWSVDAAWWAKDPRQTELSNRILAFFAKQGTNYPGTYTLDGTSLSPQDSLGLVATNAIAALAATHPRAWRFVDTLYKWQPPTGKWRYYDGMLYMMAMLHISGRFRIIEHAEALGSAASSIPKATPAPMAKPR